VGKRLFEGEKIVRDGERAGAGEADDADASPAGGGGDGDDSVWLGHCRVKDAMPGRCAPPPGVYAAKVPYRNDLGSYLLESPPGSYSEPNTKARRVAGLRCLKLYVYCTGSGAITCTGCRVEIGSGGVGFGSFAEGWT